MVKSIKHFGAENKMHVININTFFKIKIDPNCK